MKFNVNQQDLQQALNYCQGVIEKRSTLPILSNICSKNHYTYCTLPQTSTFALYSMTVKTSHI